MEIKIRIHCHSLPGAMFEGRTGIRLGVQKGQEVIEDVPGDGEAVTFTIPLRVTTNPRGGTPNFLGPFAHGTPDKRFIYLCWGQRQAGTADGAWDGFRRAKVHLSHLTWSSITTALETGQDIEASVHMTDDKNGPLCGSVGEDKIRWKL